MAKSKTNSSKKVGNWKNWDTAPKGNLRDKKAQKTVDRIKGNPSNYRIEDASKHGYPGGKVTVRKSDGKVVAKGAHSAVKNSTKKK